MMFRHQFLSFALLSMLGLACDPGAGAQAPPAPAPSPAPVRPPARVQLPRTPDDWHATDSVFKFMGGVKGRTIANLTTDDAHYAWKLLEAGADVLVLSPNKALLDSIDQKKKQLHIPDSQLRTRLAHADSVGLAPGEVDAVLFTRTYSVVKQRTAYFTRLREATRGLHQVAIVDFLQKKTPFGPPMAQRMDKEAIMEELGHCGFEDALALSDRIPYRVIIIAQDLEQNFGQ